MIFAKSLIALFAAMAVSVKAAPLAENLDDVTCRPLYDASYLALTTSDASNTQVANILKSVVTLIGDENPVQRIVQDVTTGLVSNAIFGPTFLLYGVATALQNAKPECKDNLAQCTTAVNHARGNTALDSDGAQAACAEAQFMCAAAYSKDEVDKMTGCEKYQGTTNQ